LATEEYHREYTRRPVEYKIGSNTERGTLNTQNVEMGNNDIQNRFEINLKEMNGKIIESSNSETKSNKNDIIDSPNQIIHINLNNIDNNENELNKSIHDTSNNTKKVNFHHKINKKMLKNIRNNSNTIKRDLIEYENKG